LETEILAVQSITGQSDASEILYYYSHNSG